MSAEIPDIAPGQVIAGADFVNQGDELMARKFKRRQGHTATPSSISAEQEYSPLPPDVPLPVAPTLIHNQVPASPSSHSDSIPPIRGIGGGTEEQPQPHAARLLRAVEEGGRGRSVSTSGHPRLPSQPKFHVDDRVGSYFEERRSLQALMESGYPVGALSMEESMVTHCVSSAVLSSYSGTRPATGSNTHRAMINRPDLDLVAVLNLEKSLYRDRELEQTREAVIQANRKIQMAKLQSKRKQRQRLEQRAGIYRDPCEVEGPEDDEEVYMASIKEEHGVVASSQNAHTIALRKALSGGSPRSSPPGSPPSKPRRPPPFERSFREIEEEFERRKAELARAEREERLYTQQMLRSQAINALHNRRAHREILENRLGTYYQRRKSGRSTSPTSPRARSRSFTGLDAANRVLSEIDNFESTLELCQEHNR